MEKPHFYYSDDYAGLQFSNGYFYYGYEKSICLECGGKNEGEYCENCEDSDIEWCFYAEYNGAEILIPFSKLGCREMFEVVDCLVTGIGVVLASK